MISCLAVQIMCLVDEDFPGFVGCVLVDADGACHEFIEKGPVVSAKNTGPDSIYPQPGYIDCIVEDEWVDELGRRLIRVNTEKPWGIQSIGGATRFIVFENQIFPDSI
jgi:hypothetical protein